LKKFSLLLLLIFFCSLTLRIYGLGDFPVGFHRDEAFLGYNSYSLLKTGREMTGDLLPLHLASYLYSPAGYSYVAIPSIAVFGLSEFSVRFPSALFGALSVLLLYIATRMLFVGYQKRQMLALLSSLLFAIIPWHINLSRTTTENTIVVFFYLLGLILFLKWREKQNFLLLFVTFSTFFVTLFLYQAPRAFLPLFLPLLFVTLAKQQVKKQWKASSILFITILLPIAFVLLSSTLSLRISSLTLTSSPEASLRLIETIHRDGEVGISHHVARMFHNKLLVFSDQFFINYFSHFTYSFLFSDAGFPDRYRIPGVGLLYLPLLPFLLFGSFALLKEKKRIGLFLIGWVLLSPIGSALTFDDVPNLQRTLFMLPPLIIIIAFGIVWIFNKLRKYKKISYFLIILVILSMTFFFVKYLHEYYVHAPAYRPWYRNAGYKELVKKTNKFLSQYKRMVVTNRESAPTIFFLFYSSYDPVRFQEETQYTAMKDFDRINFGQYQFSQEECPAREIINEGGLTKTFEEDVLYVNSGLCKEPESLRVLEIIKREDNSEVFHIVEAK